VVHLNAIAKGAPVDWVPMDIVPTNVGGAAISVQPPHLLLADFLLGPEGQEVLKIRIRQRREKSCPSCGGARIMASPSKSTRRI